MYSVQSALPAQYVLTELKIAVSISLLALLLSCLGAAAVLEVIAGAEKELLALGGYS